MIKITYFKKDETKIGGCYLSIMQSIKRIDELYMENYDDFLMLCRQLNIEDAQSIQKYNHLKNKICYKKRKNKQISPFGITKTFPPFFHDISPFPFHISQRRSFISPPAACILLIFYSGHSTCVISG